MRVTQKDVVFVMIDVQEKFEPHIQDMPAVVKNANLLNKFAEIMEIPLLVTEQNPQGLGKTLNSIYIPADHKLIAKTRFSIFEPEIENYIESLHDGELSIATGNKLSYHKHIVLYGIESHVCITQSVLECLEKKYHPIVISDAVSSISPQDKEAGLRRIIAEGGTVASTEMIMFELLQGAYHPHFKSVNKLIKESK